MSGEEDLGQVISVVDSDWGQDTLTDQASLTHSNPVPVSHFYLQLFLTIKQLRHVHLSVLSSLVSGLKFSLLTDNEFNLKHLFNIYINLQSQATMQKITTIK